MCECAKIISFVHIFHRVLRAKTLTPLAFHQDVHTRDRASIFFVAARRNSDSSTTDLHMWHYFFCSSCRVYHFGSCDVHLAFLRLLHFQFIIITWLCQMHCHFLLSQLHWIFFAHRYRTNRWMCSSKCIQIYSEADWFSLESCNDDVTTAAVAVARCVVIRSIQ